MIPESFAETSQPRHIQPAHSRCGLPAGRGRSRNVGLETFEKLSAKLKERSLPGIEFAENYLFHLYRKNRRPNTLELNYTSIRLFLEYLKTAGITHLEGVSQEQSRGLRRTRAGPGHEACLRQGKAWFGEGLPALFDRRGCGSPAKSYPGALR